MWNPNQSFALSPLIGVSGLDAGLRVHGADGRILCSVVMVATLYMREGDTHDIRLGIVRAYDRYIRSAGDVMRWGMDPRTGESVNLVGSPWADVRRWPADVFEFFDLQILQSAGPRVDDASPHRFVAISRAREPGQLSYLSVTLPVSWVNEHSPLKHLRG